MTVRQADTMPGDLGPGRKLAPGTEAHFASQYKSRRGGPSGLSSIRLLVIDIDVIKIYTSIEASRGRPPAGCRSVSTDLDWF
jgi:hypothetical protein